MNCTKRVSKTTEMRSAETRFRIYVCTLHTPHGDHKLIPPRNEFIALSTYSKVFQTCLHSTRWYFQRICRSVLPHLNCGLCASHLSRTCRSADFPTPGAYLYGCDESSDTIPAWTAVAHHVLRSQDLLYLIRLSCCHVRRHNCLLQCLMMRWCRSAFRFWDD